MKNLKENKKRLDKSYLMEMVLSVIPEEPKGLHHKKIASMLGLGYVQTRDIIRELRNLGYPICSNSRDGYWMARDTAEIDRVILMFESYMWSMKQTVIALRKARRDYE